MISDILNGTILFFVIGIFTILCFSQPGSIEPQQELTAFVDYDLIPNCKNLVERPPQKWNGLDIGQGYDCEDD